jgi:prephenate dehydratase
MKKIRAAYQGYPGAYSDEACRQIFGEVDTVGFRTFEEAFISVREGNCDVAVLPFENSLGTLFLCFAGYQCFRWEHTLQL